MGYKQNIHFHSQRLTAENYAGTFLVQSNVVSEAARQGGVKEVRTTFYLHILERHTETG